MSLDRIVGSFKRIEITLVDRYGAQGSGIKEKLQAVEGQLPADVVNEIRSLAHVRNKAVHDDYEHRDVDGFCARADAVVTALVQAADRRDERRRAQAAAPPAAPAQVRVVRRVSWRQALGCVALGLVAGLVGGVIAGAQLQESALQDRNEKLRQALAQVIGERNQARKAVDEAAAQERRLRDDVSQAQSAAAQAAAKLKTAQTEARQLKQESRVRTPPASTLEPSVETAPRPAPAASTTAEGHRVFSAAGIPVQLLSFGYRQGSFGRQEPAIRVSITNGTSSTLSSLAFKGALYLDGSSRPVVQSGEEWSAFMGEHGLRSGETRVIDLFLGGFGEREWATPDILNASSRRLELRLVSGRDGSNRPLSLGR